MAGEIQIDLPFLGGQDTGTELSAGVRLRSMTNCVYRKNGGIRKRYGATRLNTSSTISSTDTLGVKPTLASAGGGGTGATRPTAMFEANGEPAVVSSPYVKSFSNKTAAWYSKDFALSGFSARSAEVATIAVGQGSLASSNNVAISCTDCACTSDYVAVTWVEVYNEGSSPTHQKIYASIYDTDSLTPIVSRYLLASTTNTFASAPAISRVVRLGSNFLFLYSAGLGTGTIKRVTLTTSTMAWSSATNLLTAASASITAKNFEVSSQRGSWTTYVICYYSGSDWTLAKYNNSHTATTEVTPTGLDDYKGCIALDYGQNEVFGARAEVTAQKAIAFFANTSLLSYTSNDMSYTAGVTFTRCGVGDIGSTAVFAFESSSRVYYVVANGSLAATNNASAFNTNLLSYPGGFSGASYSLALLRSSSTDNYGMGVLAGLAFGTTVIQKPYPVSVFTGLESTPPKISSYTVTAPPCRLATVDETTVFTVSCALGPNGAISEARLYATSASTSVTTSVTTGWSSPVFANGMVRQYDGGQVAEIAPLTVPKITVASTAGSATNGTYEIAAVYAWRDANGNVMRGAPDTTSFTMSAGGMTVTVPSLQISDAHWANKPVFIELYVSDVGQTTPLLYDTLAIDAATASYTWTITATWTSTGAPELYTDGGVLDNVCPPGGTCVAVHKQRIFVGGTPDDTIWYSKAFVNSEVPGFNEGLTIQPFDGGRVVAMASLDQFLLILKEEGLYSLQGDGPDDEGNDSSFGLPTRISSDTGCTERKSVVVIPPGVLFRGARGIYLCTNGGQVQYIGKAIENSLTSSTTITDAVVYAKESQVWFFTGTSSVYVFDYLNNAWSVFTFLTSASASILPAVGCVINDTLYFADTESALFKLDTTTYIDDSATWVPMSFSTAFFRPPDGIVQGDYRLKELGVKLQGMTSAGISLTIARDYDPTQTETRSWTSTEVAAMDGGAYQRECRVHPTTQKVQSMSLTFTDVAPISGGNGTGEGFGVQGIGMYVKPKTGITKGSTEKQK